jgi:hypothetical protein
MSNIFDLGSCTVEVYNDLQSTPSFSGTMGRGGTQTFPDGGGNNLTLSVDGSGLVSLDTDDPAFPESGRQFMVIVSAPSAVDSLSVSSITSASTFGDFVSTNVTHPSLSDLGYSALTSATPPTPWQPDPVGGAGGEMAAGVQVQWA